jgi:hypothetical protein
MSFDFFLQQCKANIHTDDDFYVFLSPLFREIYYVCKTFCLRLFAYFYLTKNKLTQKVFLCEWKLKFSVRKLMNNTLSIWQIEELQTVSRTRNKLIHFQLWHDTKQTKNTFLRVFKSHWDLKISFLFFHKWFFFHRIYK